MAFQLFAVVLDAQTNVVSDEYMADSLLTKIYLDRQQGAQTVDLSAIEAAIAENESEAFVVAKKIGQAIMAIFDKEPYYQGLTAENYGPHTQILHEQVAYCKAKNFPSLTLFTLEVLQFVYDFAYQKEKVIAACTEGLDYYESLSDQERAKVRNVKYLLAAFSYGVLQQKMMYHEYAGIKKWLDLAFEKGKAYHESAKHKKGSVVFYARPLSEAASYYLQLNKPDSSVYYWDLAAKESEKCENFEMMLAVLNQKARLFLMQESYTEALDVYFKNLEVARKVENANVEVASLNGIATCHKFLGNRDKAKKYYHQLMHQIAQKEEIQIGLLPIVYKGIAVFYETEGRLDSSIYYKQKEKQVYIDLGGNSELFTSNIELATLYLGVQDTLEANKAFAAAMKQGLPPVNDRNLVLSLAAIASYSERIGDYLNMIFYAKKAFHLSKQMNLVGEGVQAAEQLVEGYLYLEQQDSATKYLKEFKHLQKEFFKIVQDSALLDLQAKYETKEKEQEIAVLDAQNRLERKNKNLSLGFLGFAICIGGWAIFLYIRQRKVSKELQQLQATKDKLFSIIAHDLRTPFNALMGFSKTLKDSGTLSESTELKSSITAIHQSSRNAYFLFEDLLAWAKAQTGELRFHPESLHLQDSLQESLGPLEGMIQFKRIDVQTDFQAAWVRADVYMLNTIMRNLLTNAIKFLDYKGKIMIQSQLEGDLVRISIEDTGKGMSAEELNALFVEGEKKKGLGLLLCKDFVEQQGGTIQASSKLNKGTHISFTLPKGLAQTRLVEKEMPVLEKKLVLSPVALGLLRPKLEYLTAMSVYYSTDLKNMVRELRVHQDASLSEWLHLMNQAIDESDTGLYQELIGYIK